MLGSETPFVAKDGDSASGTWSEKDHVKNDAAAHECLGRSWAGCASVWGGDTAISSESGAAEANGLV